MIDCLKPFAEFCGDPFKWGNSSKTASSSEEPHQIPYFSWLDEKKVMSIKKKVVKFSPTGDLSVRNAQIIQDAWPKEMESILIPWTMPILEEMLKKYGDAEEVKAGSYELIRLLESLQRGFCHLALDSDSKIYVVNDWVYLRIRSIEQSPRKEGRDEDELDLENQNYRLLVTHGTYSLPHTRRARTISLREATMKIQDLHRHDFPIDYNNVEDYYVKEGPWCGATRISRHFVYSANTYKRPMMQRCIWMRKKEALGLCVRFAEKIESTASNRDSAYSYSQSTQRLNLDAKKLEMDGIYSVANITELVKKRAASSDVEPRNIERVCKKLQDHNAYLIETTKDNKVYCAMDEVHLKFTQQDLQLYRTYLATFAKTPLRISHRGSLPKPKFTKTDAVVPFAAINPMDDTVESCALKIFDETAIVVDDVDVLMDEEPVRNVLFADGFIPVRSQIVNIEGTLQDNAEAVKRLKTSQRILPLERHTPTLCI